MARLIAYAAADERIGAIMRKTGYDCARVGRRAVHVNSTNRLVRNGELDVLGGKTGFISSSGYCLATLVRLPQTGRQVAVVVLGARSNAGRFAETKHLFNWLSGHTSRPRWPPTARSRPAASSSRPTARPRLPPPAAPPSSRLIALFHHRLIQRQRRHRVERQEERPAGASARRAPSSSGGRLARGHLVDAVVRREARGCGRVARQWWQRRISKGQRPWHRPQTSRRSPPLPSTANTGRPPHIGQVARAPALDRHALQQHVGGAGQERTHRQRQHVAQDWIDGSPPRTGRPGADSNQRPTTSGSSAPRSSAWSRRRVGGLEHVVPAQHVDHLADPQPQLGPVEAQVASSTRHSPRGQARREQVLGRGVDPRRADAAAAAGARRRGARARARPPAPAQGAGRPDRSAPPISRGAARSGRGERPRANSTQPLVCGRPAPVT